MFSTGHLIWIAISAAAIIGGCVAVKRKNPTLEQVLKACLVVGAASEIVKIFCVTSILPVVTPRIAMDAAGPALQYVPIGQYTPYLKMEHLPLEMCSLMIPFLAAALLIKNNVWRSRLLALMYISGTIGGTLGLLLCFIAGEYDSPAAFFAAPRVWQFFLYHAMVVFLGIYLGFIRESGFSLRNWKSTVLMLLVLDLPTFYLNSVFSQAVYVDGAPVGVAYSTNFFSSYVNPLGLVLTEKWQWLVYLAVRLALAGALTALMLWLSSLKRARRAR